MNKFLKFIVIAIVIVSAAFGVYKITSEYRVSILTDNIDCNIILKGCENSKALTVIDNNIYVAFENSIIEVNENGKERIILKDKNYNIEDMESLSGDIYFISNNTLMKYSIKSDAVEEVINNISNEGELLKRKLLVLNQDLYLSISSTTNSGISAKESKVFDNPPYDMILGEGVKKNNVPFKPYGEDGVPGEKVKGASIGNASVYKIDVKSKKYKLYSTGIKNIVGWDYNSEKEIFMAVQGMEDKEPRSVSRDRDYIYTLVKDEDYGFPDFSGGDPITSPRFIKSEMIRPLLEASNKKVVPSPIYQHNSVSSINELAIDRDGSVFEKDSKVFFDNKEKTISVLNNKGVYIRTLKLNENSEVEEIKYNNNGFLILDSGVGSLYEVKGKTKFLGFNLSPIVWIIILSIAIVSLIIIVLKLLKKYQK
ncbi:MAG: hypothetical protein ACRC2K_04050 [Clostridium sp.]